MSKPEFGSVEDYTNEANIAENSGKGLRRVAIGFSAVSGAMGALSIEILVAGGETLLYMPMTIASAALSLWQANEAFDDVNIAHDTARYYREAAFRATE